MMRRCSAAMVLVVTALALAGWLAAANGAPVAVAACDYPILPLGQIAQRAPVAVVADVIRERADDTGGFTSTLRVRGTVKGRPPGPVLALGGLGLLDSQCSGGPRLPRGNRYLLFLAADGQGANLSWSLFNLEGGVYQLGLAGARIPPEQSGGRPQTLAIAPAEMVRDAGIVAGEDAGKIEALIAAVGLAETLDLPPAAPPAKPLLARLPRRDSLLAVAAAAILLAGLTYLLWRPRDLRLGGG